MSDVRPSNKDNKEEWSKALVREKIVFYTRKVE